jgi:enoyl-CoA hydratase/carnithine racemase
MLGAGGDTRHMESRLARFREIYRDPGWDSFADLRADSPNATLVILLEGDVRHPPLNIFGPQSLPQLNEIVTALETDEDVRVVVFDSAIDGFFLTHYDFLAKPEDTTDLPPGDVETRLGYHVGQISR